MIDPIEICYSIIDIRKDVVFQTRLEFEDCPMSEWSQYIISPARNYGETFWCDPFVMQEVQIIEIDHVEVTVTGKYANNIFADHRNEICTRLDELKIQYQLTVELNIRVEILKI